MGSKASKWKDLTRVVFAAALFVALFALALLLTPPSEAQEMTAEQTVSQTRETTVQTEETKTATETENTTAEKRETTNEGEETESNVQNTPSDDSRQRAQVVSDDSQPAGRAGDPLADETSQIIDSEDPDLVVNRVVIPKEDCTVQEGASVVVEDEDGTRVRLTDGENVEITSSEDQIVAQGSQDGNLNGATLISNGSDAQFGVTNGTEEGTVVRSTGITCNNEVANGANNGDENGGNTGGSVGDDNGCDGARVVENVSGTGNQQSSPFDTNGTLFRVTSRVTATSDPDLIFFSINVRDENGDLVATIDQEQPGTQSSFVNEGAGRFFLDIAAANVQYTVTVRDCAGVASDDNGDDIVNVPDDDLPDTGGLPVSVPASCAALLLVGTSLIGIAAVRRRR